ncbi:MAG: ATP-binding protein [Treponema sp.]|nr:ATP-binding protein [Treponema sp.]MCL2272517.1 ATP-binding protein [Treponema sp.]
MTFSRVKDLISSILIGKRYYKLTDIKEQVRYMTMNWIFMVATLPLSILGFTQIGHDTTRVFIDFGIAFLCLNALIMIRSKIPLKFVPVFPVTVFGMYCCYLLYLGDLNFWAAVWLFSFPPIVIFLCQMTVGLIESIVVLIISIVLFYTPLSNIMPLGAPDGDVKLRIIGVYFLITSLSVIYESISILKDRKEAELKGELANERDMIQTMKDNINQGIFLLDKNLNILPQYSSTLISILSYYGSDLTGKSFLDILHASLDSRQLNVMKGYFAMVFSKEKSAKVLEAANPISEFEFKADDEIKYLSTRFQLIEQINSDPVIIGIVQDISREKEIERELEAQKEIQEMEMKNLFDVIKIDPLVFQNFIEDTEANFNAINALLKDRKLSEKQVVTKTFQYIHAIKSNALILDLENLAGKLHVLEDHIKNVSVKERIFTNDVLTIAVKIESFMQEMDSYIAITKKITAYKSTNQMDTILISSLTKAVDRLASESKKMVKIQAGQIDLGILESKLRKPIKEILYQCVRNSIYHGIESAGERTKKGKNPQGLLAFSVRNVEGKAEVTFSDDGGGLDWQKIKTKYVENNPGTNPDRKILLSSIFSPEFSTAEETSTAAGRGVGLSFVKDIAKEYNGNINVNSTESGLVFKFTFPIPK